MWSLFEKIDDKEVVLKPLVFSNGKSQEDIVREVVEEIKKGEKIILIHGKCGTGKSIIALNIAKELGKASIVVPIKNLQRQYENDYMHKKFVLKDNKEKLKIAHITGRQNHLCKYLEEKNRKGLEELHKKDLENFPEEKNANLFDIFKNTKKIEDKEKSEKHLREFKEISCDNMLIPCKIEIKEKNLELLKKYYRENPELKSEVKNKFKNLSTKMLKRFAIAPACEYWSPIISSLKEIDLDAQEKVYDSVSGKHIIYLRKEGCGYYKQFLSYIKGESDVILFNSDSYLLETALGRKPATEIEIIDECDEFLDNLSVEGSVNLNRLRKELVMWNSDNEKDKIILELVIEIIDEILRESRKYVSNDDSESIKSITNTKSEELIKSIVNNDIFYENRDDESYVEHCLETSRQFYELLKDTYIGFSKDKFGNTYLKLVTINLDKMLDSIIKKNKAFVFMSGTLHSERILKEVFGLKKFKIIDAETYAPGTIEKVRTGLEKDFSFDNFEKNNVTREEYLKALDKCLEKAKKPVVVHVTAFYDLPSAEETEKLSLKNLIPREKLIEEQKKDKEGKIVREFKEGKTEVLFTTRCNRGIDFPFSVCNSVVITKFPYPHSKSLFWRILKKQKPNLFWEFYKDKAHRELLQRVYRSVRGRDDHVFLLSPDIRVLESKIV